MFLAKELLLITTKTSKKISTDGSFFREISIVLYNTMVYGIQIQKELLTIIFSDYCGEGILAVCEKNRRVYGIFEGNRYLLKLPDKKFGFIEKQDAIIFLEEFKKYCSKKTYQTRTISLKVFNPEREKWIKIPFDKKTL